MLHVHVADRYLALQHGSMQAPSLIWQCLMSNTVRDAGPGEEGVFIYVDVVVSRFALVFCSENRE